MNRLIQRMGKNGKFSDRLPGLMRTRARPALVCQRNLPRPQAVPASMAGQYVVWSPDGLTIRGHGETIDEALAMARSGKGDGHVIQKIPPARRIRPVTSGAIAGPEGSAGA